MNKNKFKRTHAGYNDIAGILCRQIADGTFPPGAKLPSQQKLMKDFCVSSNTALRALKRLREDGFISSRRRTGSIVLPTSPHLGTYALVVGAHDLGRAGNLYLKSLADAALNLHSYRGRNINIKVFSGIEDRYDEQSYRMLVDEVEHHRITGLIFATPPFFVEGTPIVSEPGIPRVAPMSSDDPMSKYCEGIVYEETFLEKSIAYLAGRKRLKVAIICTPQVRQYVKDKMNVLKIRYGLETRDYWIIAIELMTTFAARSAMQLIMSPDMRIKPNGLVILDDNLVESAT
ncbi:MAG: GntR family transcriptional regulator [Victivallales bacterium]